VADELSSRREAGDRLSKDQRDPNIAAPVHGRAIADYLAPIEPDEGDSDRVEIRGCLGWGEATLPTRAYEHDAGLDLAACERIELGPGERGLVGTGLTVAIPEGHAGFVQPRSGLAARHGITVLNTPGLVDAGYRGELKVVLLNTDRSESFVVEPGMRVAQLVVVPVATPALIEMDELPDSERGEKGFGSSA